MDRTARDRDLAIATDVEDRRRGLSAPGHPIIEPDVADLRHLVDLNHQPLPYGHDGSGFNRASVRASGGLFAVRDSPDVAGFPRRFVGEPAIH